MQSMKRHLKEFVLECTKNEDFQQKLNNLSVVAKSEEWKFAVQILWAIKNAMAVEMLDSQAFTKLTAQDKDITQQVYHNVSEWITFLTNPKGWIRKKGLLQLIESKLKGEAIRRRA